MYSVSLAKSAKRFFERAPASLQRRLDQCFDHLKIEPHEGGSIKRLTGKLAGLIRYRVGEYRVIYRIDDSKREVSIVRIAHRREVYD